MAIIDRSKYTPAIVLFVLFLLFYAIVWAIKTFGQDKPDVIPYPPYVTDCPDYWQSQADGKCKPMPMVNSAGDAAQNGLATCSNTIYDTASNESSLAIAKDQEIHPTLSTDLRALSPSSRCKWAKKCKVHWDGLSDKNCADL